MDREPSSADVRRILSAWRIPPVGRTERFHSGVNNQSWHVETAGESFVLRIYKNAGAHHYFHFEHALLSKLSQSSLLSFAVPAPLVTASGGDTVVDAGDDFASLFPLIPGRHPKRGDIPATRLAGRALAELDSAMAVLNIESSTPQLTGYVDLRRIHPAIGDPSEPAELLGLEGDGRIHYERLVEASESVYPGLHATLPKQIIHSDYVPSNVLLQAGRVSGVLDFEFAAPDLRAMDFAVGLEHFCMVYQFDDVTLHLEYRTETEAILQLVGAFADGYFERNHLTSQEIVALPDVLLRKRVAGILHWAGRWRVGLATERDVRERLDATFRLTNWLEEHADTLVGRLLDRG